MTREDLRKYVMKIMDYLRSDFNGYEKARKERIHVGAGPYLLTTSSGMDFLGSLAVPEEKLTNYEKEGTGLERKSNKGSKWYIKTYLGEINQQCLSPNVDELIYKSLRCGQVHEGIVKKRVLISTEIPEEYHLAKAKVKESSESDTIHIFVCVNTRLLASDFIQSMELFKNDLFTNDTFADQMAVRLSEHLNAVEDVCQGLDLPEKEVDPDVFYSIYEKSSYSPEHPEGQFWLKSNFRVDA